EREQPARGLRELPGGKRDGADRRAAVRAGGGAVAAVPPEAGGSPLAAGVLDRLSSARLLGVRLLPALRGGSGMPSPALRAARPRCSGDIALVTTGPRRPDGHTRHTLCPCIGAGNHVSLQGPGGGRAQGTAERNTGESGPGS